ncbi:MAG: hypothetical protein HKO67_07190 [Flavobacteriaceae bacterium]|nr:hypothetical protein [Bacteroidia bacterium]NNF81876.1 hypothetical protein [Flavobacteriaceae bacterium]NNL80256.1 hypothetical protein [Flavobacteriaceae bacterium]
MAISLPTPRLVARILALAAIGFVSLFALDAFGHGKPILVQIKDFLIHLIPSFILLIAFFIAYKRELIGGIIFILIGLANAPWIYKNNYAMNQSVGMSLLIITTLLAPFIIAGILFIVSYFKTKKANKAT